MQRILNTECTSCNGEVAASNECLFLHKPSLKNKKMNAQVFNSFL